VSYGTNNDWRDEYCIIIIIIIISIIIIIIIIITSAAWSYFVVSYYSIIEIWTCPMSCIMIHGCEINWIELNWKESIIVPIHKDNKTECSNYCGISLLLTSYKIKVKSIYRLNYCRLSVWVFYVTDQLLIIFFAFVRYWRKNGSTMR
jgi:hypothetical protein